MAVCIGRTVSPQRFPGHAGSVNALTVRPEPWLASGMRDATVTLVLPFLTVTRHMIYTLYYATQSHSRQSPQRQAHSGKSNR